MEPKDAGCRIVQQPAHALPQPISCVMRCIAEQEVWSKLSQSSDLHLPLQLTDGGAVMSAVTGSAMFPDGLIYACPPVLQQSRTGNLGVTGSSFALLSKCYRYDSPRSPMIGCDRRLTSGPGALRVCPVFVRGGVGWTNRDVIYACRRMSVARAAKRRTRGAPPSDSPSY